MKDRDLKVIIKAIRTYGPMAQTAKAIEELSELQRALSKRVYQSLAPLSKHPPEKCNITEEMADVEIMLEELKIIFCNSDLVKEWKTKKIARLAERLKNET